LSAPHVSRDVFAHHQEQLTLFKPPVLFKDVAGGWCHRRVETRSNASMTPVGKDIVEYYKML
jgi:hypothetical protein